MANMLDSLVIHGFIFYKKLVSVQVDLIFSLFVLLVGKFYLLELYKQPSHFLVLDGQKASHLKIVLNSPSCALA